jgi:hypothetical protein
MFGKKYQSQSNALASYNWTDLAANTGVVQFYGFVNEISGSVLRGLSQQTLYSSEIEKYYLNTNDAWTQVMDLDFDLTPFNAPATIMGVGQIQQGYYLQGSAAYARVFFIYRVRKWDGSTETEIASVVSQYTQTDATIVMPVANLPITIPQTQFKIGEQLRLTVEVWMMRVGAANTYFALGEDPKNRDGTYIKPSTVSTTSSLIFACPFSLDL